MVVSLDHECRLIKEGYDIIIGVDEAGRGPLCGPVVAGGFVLMGLKNKQQLDLTNAFPWKLVADSKVLSEKSRSIIFDHLSKDLKGDTLNRPDRSQVTVYRGFVPKNSPQPIKDRKETDAQTQNSETIIDENMSVDNFEDSATSTIDSSTVESFIPPEEKSLEPINFPSSDDENSGTTTQDEMTDLIEVSFCHAECSPEEIDRLNILEATMVAMSRVVISLLIRSVIDDSDDHDNNTDEMASCNVAVVIDGNRSPEFFRKFSELFTNERFREIAAGMDKARIESLWDRVVKKVKQLKVWTEIKGDARIFSISVASIVAKVYRDRLMVNEIAPECDPEYKISENKGYPTPFHKEMVRKLGPTKYHRMSFQPILGLLINKQFQVPDGRHVAELDYLIEKKNSKKSKRKFDSIESLDSTNEKKITQLTLAPLETGVSSKRRLIKNILTQETDDVSFADHDLIT